MSKIVKIVKYTEKFVESVKASGLLFGIEKARCFLNRRSSIRKFNKDTGLTWSFTDNNHEVNAYNSNYQENIDFSQNKSEIRPIIFIYRSFIG